MYKILVLLSCVLAGSSAHNELMDLLAQQKDLNVSATEIDALLPFFRELQAQYDYLYSLKLQNGDGSGEPEAEPQIDGSYGKAFEEFRNQFSIYLKDEPSIVYDTSLPTLEQLLGKPTADMTHEQQLEFEDLESIMQDVIDEAKEGIDQLVQRALDVEGNLLKLNKPKIVTAALNGLGYMWNYWGRGSHAAYCSYAHVPQMTEALHAVNGGVDCYAHTMRLILRIQTDTVASVKEIRRNVYDLVKIYKKIASKNTLTGKIMSGTLNLFKALRRVHDIIAVGLDGYGKIQNELPGAALETKQCGLDFAHSIPQMIETAQNLTSCIVFVDPDKPDYEFMRPEDDRYWNTGELPPDIPHENDVDQDDDETDDDDDYVDHR